MEETWELAALVMLPPEEDLEERTKVWEAMEVFWLDTDPYIFFDRSVKACAASKYSLTELKKIFELEVHPALIFNLLDIAGEWCGFHPDFVRERVLEKHKYQSKLNMLDKINYRQFKLKDDLDKLISSVRKIREK